MKIRKDRVFLYRDLHPGEGVMKEKIFANSENPS